MLRKEHLKMCAYSFNKCPFCNSDWRSKTDEENVEELMKRVDLNDAGAMCWLGEYYNKGGRGLQQDWEKKKLGNRLWHLGLVRRISNWVFILWRMRFKESQGGRGYGWIWIVKMQTWNNGGKIWKCRMSSETLGNCLWHALKKVMSIEIQLI